MFKSSPNILIPRSNKIKYGKSRAVVPTQTHICLNCKCSYQETIFSALRKGKIEGSNENYCSSECQLSYGVRGLESDEEIDEALQLIGGLACHFRQPSYLSK